MLSKVASRGSTHRYVNLLEPGESLEPMARQPQRAPWVDRCVRCAKVTGRVIAAPPKLIATPVVGMALGSVMGLADGMYYGAVGPLVAGALLGDQIDKAAQGGQPCAQKWFELAVKHACLTAALLVITPVGVAAGAVGGAGWGALTGTAFGIAEGYQACSGGGAPKFKRYLHKKTAYAMYQALCGRHPNDHKKPTAQ